MKILFFKISLVIGLCMMFSAFQTSTLAQSCPSGVYIESLRGVSPFAQDDQIVACGDADTLAVLIFSTAPNPLSNVEFTLDLPTGLSYADFVNGYFTGNDITFSQLLPSGDPVFLIPQLDSLEIMVAYIGIKSDCKIKTGANIAGSLSYDYGGLSCNTNSIIINDYDTQLKTSVLNILSVQDPIDNNSTIVLTDNTTSGCHTILISQDGIDAYVDSFNFQADGINGDNYTITGFKVNGIDYPYIYDPALMSLSSDIGGAVFLGNYDPGGLPPNERFHENEQLNVQICYTSNGCNEGTDILKYSATWGCNNLVCDKPTEKEGAITYQPDFGAYPIVSNATISQTGAFCGDNIVYSFNIISANTNPLEGLWNDLFVHWKSCVTSNSMIESISVNGFILSPSVWSLSASNEEVQLNFVNLDSNIDGIGIGIEDTDGDGQYDDLPGGNSLNIEVNIDIVCISSTNGNCTANACDIEKIELSGVRNCTSIFQDFNDISPNIVFSYGEANYTTNETQQDQDQIYVTEVVNTIMNERVACSIIPPGDDNLATYTTQNWTPGLEGFSLHYEFGTENIAPCSPTSNIYFEAIITSISKRYRWIKYEANSATYQGVPVPGTTFDPILDTFSDTIGYLLRIPAGDPLAAAHDYYFNLEYFGVCAPDSYTNVNMQVIEECTACVSPNPCKILRSCHELSNRVKWNGLNCCCPIESVVEQLNRVNYGYTDCSMTTKVDPSSVPIEDTKRFLPGDTMHIKASYKVLDKEVFYDADYKWSFMIYQYYEGGPLQLDCNQAKLLHFSFEKEGTGIENEIGMASFSQYPDSIRDNVNYPSIEFVNLGYGSYSDYTIPSTNAYGNCVNQPNPNYPIETAANGFQSYTSYSSYHGYMGLQLFFRSRIDCPTDSYDTQNNTAHQDLLTQLDLDNGDKFYIELEVPVFHNPTYEINAGAPAKAIYPEAYTYKRGPCTGTDTQLGNACWTPASFEGHLPGPIVDETNVTITDCDVQVNHTLSISNPLPAVTPGQLPWFENEYRPIFATEYLQPSFPTNLVYIGGATITDPDGTIRQIAGDHVDDNYGNLTCIPDATGGVCCMAQDSTSLASLRFVDDDYYRAKDIKYMLNNVTGLQQNETGLICDDDPLWLDLQKNPFPMLGVGGSSPCSYQLSFPLTPLCPDAMQSADFALTGQFAEKYVPNLGNGIWSTFNQYDNWYNYTTDIFPTNPYTDGNLTSLEYYWSSIYPNPELSNILNPSRQISTWSTSPDNFTDNSTDYPVLVSTVSNPLIADLSGSSEHVTYQVCAGMEGAATHTNVSNVINVPLAIDLLSITGSGGPIGYTLLAINDTSKLYSFISNDLAPGQCQFFDIETELLFCPIGLDISTQICVKTISGCLTPEKAALLSIAGISSCDSSSACYQYIQEEAGLQVEWVSPTYSDFDLCEAIVFEARIKNVRPALLIDLVPRFFLPTGLEYVPGSWELAYPGGPTTYSDWTSIPDPTMLGSTAYGVEHSWADASLWSPYIDANGLTGISGTAAITDSNKVAFRFTAKTLCDLFVSGTKPYFIASASDPCETTIYSNTVSSLPLIINNANPADYPKLLSIADPGQIHCGSTARMNISVLNISPTNVATQNAKACFVIPSGNLIYTPGSVSYNVPLAFPTNAVETVTATGIQICLDTPDGIGQGQLFSFGFDVSLADDVACGVEQISIQIATEIVNQTCVGQAEPCKLFVLNSVNPLLDIQLAPPLAIDDITITTICDTDPENVTLGYEVNFTNPGTNTYSNTILIEAVQDVNANNLVEDFDIVIASSSNAISLQAGQSTILSGTLLVPNDQACPILINVNQNSSCVCQNNPFVISDILPDFIDDVGSEIELCANNTIDIQFCPTLYTLALSPPEAGTLTISGSIATIGLNEGFGIDFPVQLVATGGVGECSESYAVDVYQDNIAIDIGGTYAGACVPATNKYILNVSVMYEGLLAGELITINGIQVAVDGSGNQLFSFAGYEANGLPVDITVELVSPMDCNATALAVIVAPEPCEIVCPVPNCIDIQVAPGN